MVSEISSAVWLTSCGETFHVNMIASVRRTEVKRKLGFRSRKTVLRTP